MTLTELANVGEFVGGMAVIFSLAYLALQIRQNTRSVRSASFQSLVDSFSQVSLELSKDAELTRIYTTGLSEPGQLTEQELQRFHFLILTSTRRFESAFMQQHSMVLSPNQWEGFRSSATGILRSPGGSKWWSDNQRLFTKEFQEFVESELARRSVRG